MQLSRRNLCLGLGAAAMAQAARAKPASEQTLYAKQTLYERAIVVDALGGPGGSDPNAGPDAPPTAQDLADVRACGVTVVNLTVSQVGADPRAYDDTLQVIGFADRNIAAHPEIFLKIRTSADLDLAKRTNRLGIVYGFQDTHLLGPTLERVPLFYDRGVRVIQLTYNRRNHVGDGCLEAENKGLSPFGRDMIGELNARRILVDLSHAGRRTTLEAIAASTSPVAITHTGCRALADVPRNVDDEALRALAERGGVAGVYLTPFLRVAGQPVAEDVLRHIEHMLDVCGEDGVGIGTDGAISPVVADAAYRKALRDMVAERRRKGIAAPNEDPDVMSFVPEYNHPRRLERLALDLERRRLPARIVEKVIGANFARLFRQVWA